jgi:hypothetical protein
MILVEYDLCCFQSDNSNVPVIILGKALQIISEIHIPPQFSWKDKNSASEKIQWETAENLRCFCQWHLHLKPCSNIIFLACLFVNCHEPLRVSLFWIHCILGSQKLCKLVTSWVIGNRLISHIGLHVDHLVWSCWLWKLSLEASHFSEML